MHEDTFMCRWTMRTEGLVAQGLPFELTQQGMLRAEFVPGCTLLKYVGLAMDVMSFMQQLRRVTGRDSFQVRFFSSMEKSIALLPKLPRC